MTSFYYTIVVLLENINPITSSFEQTLKKSQRKKNVTPKTIESNHNQLEQIDRLFFVLCVYNDHRIVSKLATWVSWEPVTPKLLNASRSRSKTCSQRKSNPKRNSHPELSISSLVNVFGVFIMVTTIELCHSETAAN